MNADYYSTPSERNKKKQHKKKESTELTDNASKERGSDARLPSVVCQRPIGTASINFVPCSLALIIINPTISFLDL